MVEVSGKSTRRHRGVGARRTGLTRIIAHGYVRTALAQQLTPRCARTNCRQPGRIVKPAGSSTLANVDLSV